ncbi:Ig-like domain-containing protein [Enterococcus malodoratus]|uniref:Ig-like domain-containing protein n=1 Tax=Enterococcus malodoratus TaxID=71451 RepID=UPI003FCF1D43
MFSKIASIVLSASLLLSIPVLAAADVNQSDSTETQIEKTSGTESSEPTPPLTTDSSSTVSTSSSESLPSKENLELVEAEPTDNTTSDQPAGTTDSNEETDPVTPRIQDLAKSTKAAESVDTWAELKTAVQNKNITAITVTTDLTASSTGPKVDHGVAVDFGNHQLDIKGYDFDIKDTGALTLKDLKFTGTGVGNLAEGEGKLTLMGTVSSGPGNHAGIADMNTGTVVFDGVVLTYDRDTAIAGGVIAKFFTITNQSQVTSTAIRFYENQVAASDGSQIIIEKGSIVKTNSDKGSISGQVWKVERQTDFWIRDEGTKLLMEGNIAYTGEDGGLFIFNAANSTMNVSDGAYFESHSQKAPALLLQSKGGSFNVKNKGKIKLISDGQSNTLGATLRFRLDGDMTFNVEDHSSIEVNKTAGNAPAIRMYGGNNKINVSGGSDFIVTNQGDGSPNDPGVDAGNQGILYTAGANNEFNLKDENSSVLIDAKNGAAIDSKTYSMNIVADPGTYFVTRGATNTAGRGTFNAGALNFTMNQVKYFDFANRRSGGGRIIESSASSKFESNKADLAVWNAGSDLNGTPTRQWFTVDYKLSGTDLANLDSSSSATMSSEFGKLTNYSRMMANNQAAVIEDLRVPTNADKYIYAHASVPEAKGEIRDAYDNEVLLKIGIYDTTGKEVGQVQGTSVGSAMSVYGDPARAGMFKIDSSDKDFLKAGYTMKVLEAWSGQYEGKWIHQSRPEDIKTDSVLTYDVTPTKPAKLVGNATTIAPGTKELQGTGESNTDVSLTLNGKETGLTAKTDSSGKFTLTLPDNLKKNDVLQIFLRDHAGKAEISNPPAINNAVGNIEPAEELTFHDADFLAALKVKVAGSLEFTAPSAIDFGMNEITTSTQTLTPKITGSLEVSDTRGATAGDWQLLLSEKTGLTSADNDLSGLLVYTNQGGKVSIGSTPALVEKSDKDSRSQVISDNWNKEYGLHLVVPVEKQLKGDYNGTLNWTLQDVPGN